MTAGERGGGAVREARRWVERLAHVGFAAKSLLYLVVAGLCLRAALGPEQAEGPLGAVAAIARTDLGRVLLVVSVPGFAAYCVWRIMQAILDPERLGRGLVAIVVRVGNGVTGLVYGGLTVIVLRELVGVDPEAFGVLRALLADTLGTPAGRVGLVAFGLTLGVVGLVQLQTAHTGRFLETLDLTGLGRRGRQAVRCLGRIAFTLWGVVFGLMGYYAIKGAVTGHATEAQGIGGTLRNVEDRQLFEPWPLFLIGMGFAAFAIYAALEAGRRRIRAA